MCLSETGDARASLETRLEQDLAEQARLLLKRLLDGEEVDSELKEFVEKCESSSHDVPFRPANVGQTFWMAHRPCMMKRSKS
jgi:hypothetical protein